MSFLESGTENLASHKRHIDSLAVSPNAGSSNSLITDNKSESNNDLFVEENPCNKNFPTTSIFEDVKNNKSVLEKNNLEVKKSNNNNENINLVSQKSYLRRKEKLERAFNQKKRCLKFIKQYEEEELPVGKEIERLELIDKLRGKVLRIEQVLASYIDYQDAEYDNTFQVNNKICIMDTDLDPLNELLTAHINNLTHKDDIRTGYKCVTMEDVENMLNIIKNNKDCTIFDVVVPKDKEKFEEFVLNIVEKTNAYCRKVIFKLMSDEYSNNNNSQNNLSNIENLSNNKSNLQVDFDQKDIDYSLHDKLINCKKTGELLVSTDEKSESIYSSEDSSDEVLEIDSESDHSNTNLENNEKKRKYSEENFENIKSKKTKLNTCKTDSFDIIDIDYSEDSLNSLHSCNSKTIHSKNNTLKIDEIVELEETDDWSIDSNIEESQKLNYPELINIDSDEEKTSNSTEAEVEVLYESKK